MVDSPGLDGMMIHLTIGKMSLMQQRGTKVIPFRAVFAA
jgi:hypothetical protein